MKKLILFYILLFQINLLAAQEWCESTLVSCDSVFIDSIIFAEFPTTGDHVVFQITTDHYFLYAPSFLVCTDDIDFSDPDYGYFSIYGSAQINPSYSYTNINTSDDIFEGNMIVNNAANTSESCIISFSVPMPDQSTGINDDSQRDKIKISPNPANNYIYIHLDNPNDKIKNATLVDAVGRQHKIKVNSFLIDVTDLFTGIYVLKLKLENGELFSQKIMITQK